MKNRKRIVVLFLLVAVMFIGVGFAALTDSLTIIGNAHIDIDTANKTFDERVYFSAANPTSTTGTGTVADVASYTADDATYTVNKLAIVGEQSVFTFTITNDSNVAAQISVNANKLSGDKNPSNSNEWKDEVGNTGLFDVQYTYPQGQTIASNGGTITVVITITLKRPVTSATSATFGIELTATAN